MNLNKIVNLIRYLGGVPKSIYVNFRLLPLSQAIYLPIIVSRKTKLKSLTGKVYLSKLKPGIVRIGFGSADIFDYRYQRTVLKVDGTIHFQGKAKIGMGSRIIINGDFYVGNNFITTGNNIIFCSKKISIGNHTMLGWDSIIMDTDQHNIYDSGNNLINEAKEVVLGDNVWIGAKALILKNVKVDDGCIVGANITLTKSLSQTNSIIAGVPPRIVKSNIRWEA